MDLSETTPAGVDELVPMPAARSVALRVQGARIVHAEMIDAVLTGGGVGSVAALAAERLRGTVAIVLPEVDVAVISPEDRASRMEELRRYVRGGLQGEVRAAPGGLAGELPIELLGERLGSVLVLEPMVDASRTSEMLELTALAALTAVTLAHGTALTQRRARADLLEDIRRHPGPPVAEVLARARRLGCDLERGAFALCVRPAGGDTERVVATIEEMPGALAAVREDRVEALLPAGDGEAPGDDAVVRRLARRLFDRAPAALAPFEPSPADVGIALDAAEIGLLLVEQAGVGHEDLLIGSWRLLVRTAATDPRQLDALIDGTVGPVLDPAHPSQAAPVDTLSGYLDQGANMTAAADALYLHRHTVSSHLERVAETTGHDPLSPHGQEQLALGLKALAIRRVLDGSGPAEPVADAR